MAYEKCKQCKKQFVVDYSNPNIHYGPTPTICSPCKEFNALPIGGTYQNEKGEFLTKTAESKFDERVKYHQDKENEFWRVKVKVRESMRNENGMGFCFHLCGQKHHVPHNSALWIVKSQKLAVASFIWDEIESVTIERVQ